MKKYQRFTFDGSTDFEAYNKAEQYLKERGFSTGSMQAGSPTAVMYGDYDISKWRNLEHEEKDMVHGQITAHTSFRASPVFVDIFDDAPAGAHEAIKESA